MTSFSPSQRTSFRFNFLINTGLLIIFFLYNVFCYMMSYSRPALSSSIIFIIIILVQVVTELFTTRIRQVSFDAEKHNLIISHKSMMGNLKERVLPFHKIQFLLQEQKSGFLFRKKYLTIHILRLNKKVFEITNLKDGYNQQTQNDII